AGYGQTRRLNGRRGQRQPRRVCVAAEGRRSSHRTGRNRRLGGRTRKGQCISRPGRFSVTSSILWRLPLGPTPLPMLYTLKPPASHCSRILMKPSAVAVAGDAPRLTHVTPSCLRKSMFSSVGCPALVPILMPGGIGRMVAELEAADASNAAPPIAALAKSRLAGLEGVSLFCDSGVKSPR